MERKPPGCNSESCESQDVKEAQEHHDGVQAAVGGAAHTKCELSPASSRASHDINTLVQTDVSDKVSCSTHNQLAEGHVLATFEDEAASLLTDMFLCVEV